MKVYRVTGTIQGITKILDVDYYFTSKTKAEQFIDSYSHADTELTIETIEVQ